MMPRLRRNKDEAECDRCHQLTEESNVHPATKTGQYCYDCFLTLKAASALPRPIDIRHDDAEPANANQVARDATIRRASEPCTDPDCDVRLPGHSHYIRREG